MAARYADSPQDEGYSEDPLTVGGSANMPQWLSRMPASEKTEYVMNIIAQLPTSEVVEIARRIRPRLYFNFMNHLPPEVCLKILAFLDPISLINTARTSREWLLLSMDRKLWKQLYIMEGFRVIPAEVQRFEASLNVERSRPSESTDEEHARKRRATPQRMLPSLQADVEPEIADVEMTGVNPTSLFGGQPAQETVAALGIDVPMLSPGAPSPSRLPPRLTKSSSSSSTLGDRRASSGSVLSIANSPMTSSSLVVVDRSDMKRKLNWQYLYSQRRRLEANWEAEKYTNFQLPHPDHPEEAHNECIYAIQYSGKYLVSGSRDRTLRIWDLDTKRLVRQPLKGHNGSVLCLQFDASPEEDLIVSGSSDSTVVLWRFSTGQAIQRIRKAHRESVLNVRFDKRVLVTCSKDKTIMVFNRQALNAGDLGYPVDASAVNPVPTFLNNYGFEIAPSAGLPVKAPYSIIACLQGHGAAVNAVQIHGDEIVSASGDRTIKLWNWVEQSCERTLIGHSKGIACVQYDGRRIVSGSSDNEVKVFDKESGLEVASLRAHSNLVRTVQAGFGDLPYSARADAENAKAVDFDYFRAFVAGEVCNTTLRNPLNAGSSRPQDISGYGAKLPPGGGGGKYARIVSGSYDETIIIWRRDKEGVWKAQHVLRQEEAANAAARTALPRLIRRPVITAGPAQPVQPAQPAQPAVALPQLPLPGSAAQALLAPGAPGSDAHMRAAIDHAMSHGYDTLRAILQMYPQIAAHGHLIVRLAGLPAMTRNIMIAVVKQANLINPSPALQIGVGAITQAFGPPPASPPIIPQPNPTNLATIAAHVPTQSVQPQALAQAPVVIQGLVPSPPAVHQPTLPQGHNANPPAPAPAPAAVQQPAQQPAHAPHGYGAHHHGPQANMNRVFKLQFDARRIICCSQTNTIVGWDFANGDEQIIEASRFFAPIE